MNDEGKIVWKAILTHRCAPQIKGYAGPICLLVGIETEGKVTGVKIISHNETPTFVRGMDSQWFLDQFKGKSINDPIKPFLDLDGITHATVSIDAICEGVRAAIRHSGFAGPAIPGMVSSSSPKANLQLIILGVIAFLLFLERRKPLFIIGIFIVVLAGFATQQFLSLAHIQLFIRQPWSIFSLPNSLLGLWVISLVLIVAKPRGYCFHLCPMGRLQEIIHEIMIFFPVLKTKYLENEQIPTLPRLGRTLLWLSIIITPFHPNFPAEKLEIFTAIFTGSNEIFGWIFIFFSLAGCIMVRRFYCRVLCPLNSFFVDTEQVRRLILFPVSRTQKPADNSRKEAEE